MAAIKRIACGAAMALLVSAPACGHGPGPDYCWDPVVTYTNGMRLASSTSLRNHNVYWRCDSGHVGYCDGQMHGPCRDAWRAIGTRCHGQFLPPYTPMGPTGSHTVHSADGMEHGQGESLGMLTSDGPRPSAQPPQPLSPTGGGIQDALQALGVGG